MADEAEEGLGVGFAAGALLVVVGAGGGIDVHAGEGGEEHGAFELPVAAPGCVLAVDRCPGRFRGGGEAGVGGEVGGGGEVGAVSDGTSRARVESARSAVPVLPPVRFSVPLASPISHDRAADTLAGFLKALHVNAPAEAPLSPDRGVPLKTLTDDFGKILEDVASEGIAAVLRNVQDVWDEALGAPDWEDPPVWLHGDLHPANVVVLDGTLSGVIDFGDMCAGDPAVDLAAAWVLLPTGTAARFFNAYAHADADAATIRRARGLAALKSLALILIGRAGDRGLPGGKPTWGPAGRAALDRVLASIQETGRFPRCSTLGGPAQGSLPRGTQVT